jgi:hypothetical protein
VRRRANVEDEVRSLAHLDLEGLRAVWARHYGPPPKLRAVELLRLMLAWRLQAGAYGGLDAATRRALARSGAIEPEGRRLGEGAILRRVWRGRTIEAVVIADGFRFDGKVYRSLSAIAEAATGTRWNGPRFFGLRNAEEPDG